MIRIPSIITSEMKIVYLHIPKTAGTSVNHFFMRLVGKENVGWLGIDFTIEDLSNDEKMQKYKVIGGHFTAEQAATIPAKNIQLSTVREPVSRIISYYRYVLNFPSEVKSLQLTGSLKSDLGGEFGRVVANQQCEFLGITSNVLLPEFIRDGKVSVVIVEYAQNLLDSVAAALGKASLQLPRENLGIGAEVVVDTTISETIREIASRDVLLYEELLMKNGACVRE